MFGLTTGLFILLIICILAAMAFEFINGFHDTANAVATVIYTRSLKPRTAVIWSGLWNFAGVYLGGIAVAIGIINLLPLEALVDQNINHNVAMILSLILTAIIWNLGTWYFGIPCSSSHTLLGSIFGIGIAFMFINNTGEIALNWKKVIDAGLSLLISPVFGFGLSMLLMMLFKRIIKKKKFFNEPDPLKKPPFWIRSILVLTCTSVSFSHGSNDGQKGVGLVMIILISLLPTYFALDMGKNPVNMQGNVTQIQKYICSVDSTKIASADWSKVKTIQKKTDELSTVLAVSNTPAGVPKESRFKVRQDIITIGRNADKLLAVPTFASLFSGGEIDLIKKNVKELKSNTEYAPNWVLLLISVSLGLGTMVGWKRIVVTIGEKIGKSHLSYAQGASAELIAASTIGASTLLGLPVSTTHVLSSGVAGTMAAHGGLKNLQANTIKSMLIAWLVTIPVTVAMSCGLFLLIRWII